MYLRVSEINFEFSKHKSKFREIHFFDMNREKKFSQYCYECGFN